MTTAAQVLVDGANVAKAVFRALLTGYETAIANLQTTVQTLVGDSQNHHNDIQSLQTQINDRVADIINLQGQISAASTHLGTLDGTAGGLQAQINARTQDIVNLQATAARVPGIADRTAVLETTLAAAQAAFISLSAIITGQESSGMGPIVPVLYPGLNLPGVAWATDNPFGSGQSMSAGYGEPFTSPITAATFAASARVKTTAGTAQIALGQAELFWFGCDAAGRATATFGTGGTPGGPPASYATITTTVSVADGAWHAVELDLTGAGAILFVDGKAAGTSDLMVHFYNAHPFGIRGLGGNRGLTPWTGKIAEVAVWGSQAKHTTDYSLALVPLAGSEGMTALYHLNGNGADFMSPVAVPVGTRPAVASGVRFFLAAGDSVTYSVQPVGAGVQAAMSAQVTVSGSDHPDWYEPFSANLMLFTTAITGAPLFRWLALPVIGQGGDDPSNLAGLTTTTTDATPTVIATLLLSTPGVAADISGHVLARNMTTNEAMSFSVSAVIKKIDTADASLDQVSITAFSPPDSMAACTLVPAIFGSTITLSAVGLPGTSILWRPNLQTMVI